MRRKSTFGAKFGSFPFLISHLEKTYRLVPPGKKANSLLLSFPSPREIEVCSLPLFFPWQTVALRAAALKRGGGGGDQEKGRKINKNEKNQVTGAPFPSPPLLLEGEGGAKRRGYFGNSRGGLGGNFAPSPCLVVWSRWRRRHDRVWECGWHSVWLECGINSG